MRLDRLDATGTKVTQLVWQVAEFLTDATVETNTTTLPINGPNDQNVTVTLNTPAVNPLLFTYFTGAVDMNGIDPELFTTGELTNSTTAKFTRWYAPNTVNTSTDVRFFAVNLTDPVSYVQNGSHIWNATPSGRLTFTSTNAAPIVVTTSASHGYNTGDLVNIAGETGNLAANGNWYITNLSATTFSMDNSTGSGTSAGANRWTQKANTSAINAIEPIRTMVLGTTRAQTGTTGNTLADDFRIAAEILNSTTIATVRSGAANSLNNGLIQFSAIEFLPFDPKDP